MQGWAALYLALGGVAIAFGLVSFLLGAVGAPTDPAWIFANFGVGLALVVLALVQGAQSLRERMSSGEARRVGRYGSSAILSTVLAIAIGALLGFLAERNPVRWDWTETGVHSLSDQTRKVLAGLERDVEVVAFYAPIEAPQIRSLLERYAYASDRFHYEFADPTARPDLVERFGLSEEKLGQGLLRVALGEEAVEVDEPSESALTNAMVKLSRTTEKKVYFLTGHGERPVRGEGAEGKEGFSRAAEALRNENYRAESLVLAQTGEVPDDADVVVLAGPTRPLLEEEHAALRRYLERGGALLVMVDPRANTDLLGPLAEWGVEVGDDLVVDRVQGLFGRPATPIAGEYAAHEITELLREVSMFHVARSVRAADAAGPAFTELVKTGPESWAETDLETFFEEGQAEFGEGDRRGPVSLAVAGSVRLGPAAGDGESPEAGDGEDGADEARIVVFGDSDFASNQLLDAYRNRDLFVNATNWLLGDVEAISIRPNQARPSRLSQLTAEDFSRIRYLSLFVLPEAIAVLGVFAWWWRRRAPGR